MTMRKCCMIVFVLMILRWENYDSARRIDELHEELHEKLRMLDTAIGRNVMDDNNKLRQHEATLDNLTHSINRIDHYVGDDDQRLRDIEREIQQLKDSHE